MGSIIAIISFHGNIHVLPLYTKRLTSFYTIRHVCVIDTSILIDEEKPEVSSKPEQVAIYARVSSAENKPNLDSQAERLIAYCSAKGYQMVKVVKEVGSGVNDARPKLLHLLEDVSTTVIVVEYKDRLSRFGVRYIETLLRV